RGRSVLAVLLVLIYSGRLGLLCVYPGEGWSEQRPMHGGEKPGTCPPDPAKCRHAAPPECDSDGGCPGRKKCCFRTCAMRCIDPEEGTSHAANHCTCPESQCRDLNPSLLAASPVPYLNHVASSCSWVGV
uniref:WAP domain-containing protein n=1 Tax=Chrysemys picta bellii TaxID=8478 RepID=A0A8C3IV24_CHRPI